MTEDERNDHPSSTDLSSCTRCGMRVRSTEMWAHTAHAHNVDLDGKKSKGKGGKGKGRGRSRS